MKKQGDKQSRKPADKRGDLDAPPEKAKGVKGGGRMWSDARLKTRVRAL